MRASVVTRHPDPAEDGADRERFRAQLMAKLERAGFGRTDHTLEDVFETEGAAR